MTATFVDVKLGTKTDSTEFGNTTTKYTQVKLTTTTGATPATTIGAVAYGDAIFTAQGNFADSVAAHADSNTTAGFVMATTLTHVPTAGNVVRFFGADDATATTLILGTGYPKISLVKVVGSADVQVKVEFSANQSVIVDGIYDATAKSFVNTTIDFVAMKDTAITTASGVTPAIAAETTAYDYAAAPFAKLVLDPVNGAKLYSGDGTALDTTTIPTGKTVPDSFKGEVSKDLLTALHHTKNKAAIVADVVALAAGGVTALDQVNTFKAPTFDLTKISNIELSVESGRDPNYVLKISAGEKGELNTDGLTDANVEYITIPLIGMDNGFTSTDPVTSANIAADLKLDLADIKIEVKDGSSTKTVGLMQIIQDFSGQSNLTADDFYAAFVTQLQDTAAFLTNSASPSVNLYDGISTIDVFKWDTTKNAAFSDTDITGNNSGYTSIAADAAALSFSTIDKTALLSAASKYFSGFSAEKQELLSSTNATYIELPATADFASLKSYPDDKGGTIISYTNAPVGTATAVTNYIVITKGDTLTKDNLVFVKPGATAGTYEFKDAIDVLLQTYLGKGLADSTLSFADITKFIASLGDKADGSTTATAPSILLPYTIKTFIPAADGTISKASASAAEYTYPGVNSNTIELAKFTSDKDAVASAQAPKFVLPVPKHTNSLSYDLVKKTVANVDTFDLTIKTIGREVKTFKFLDIKAADSAFKSAYILSADGSQYSLLTAANNVDGTTVADMLAKTDSASTSTMNIVNLDLQTKENYNYSASLLKFLSTIAIADATTTTDSNFSALLKNNVLKLTISVDDIALGDGSKTGTALTADVMAANKKAFAEAVAGKTLVQADVDAFYKDAAGAAKTSIDVVISSSFLPSSFASITNTSAVVTLAHFKDALATLADVLEVSYSTTLPDISTLNDVLKSIDPKFEGMNDAQKAKIGFTKDIADQTGADKFKFVADLGTSFDAADISALLNTDVLSLLGLKASDGATAGIALNSLLKFTTDTQINFANALFDSSAKTYINKDGIQVTDSVAIFNELTGEISQISGKYAAVNNTVNVANGKLITFNEVAGSGISYFQKDATRLVQDANLKNAISTAKDDILDFSGSTTTGVNVLSKAGNDTVIATNGNDIVIAGAGNDTIYAGYGKDIVVMGAGKNTVYLGKNAAGEKDLSVDTLVLNGKEGNSTVYDFDKNDVIKFVAKSSAAANTLDVTYKYINTAGSATQSTMHFDSTGAKVAASTGTPETLTVTISQSGSDALITYSSGAVITLKGVALDGATVGSGDLILGDFAGASANDATALGSLFGTVSFGATTFDANATVATELFA